ncbi:MAG: carboxypeptidase regulatory-like domain-containing protein, partial [Betaproteobacteria bacterium]
MTTTRSSYLAVAGVSLLLAACQVPPGASQSIVSAPPVGASDLGGTVTSANGPEAGVWVIAETTDLPTKFAKIVVTDDRGRYLIPELPKANYSVWVRGYGLVDSPKLQAAPGKVLDLTAVVAPSAAAAADYYPAIYWYSMLKVPERNEFPLGKAANQGQWLDLTKTDGCYTCHQLGNKATRAIPKELGHFNSSVEAWARRIASGQAMTNMTNNIGRFDAPRMLGQFADWTDRIAAGELPASRPERPQGLERNVVITLWDWSRPTAYLHDEISSDKRNPTVNAYGLLYGATEESTDFIPVLDPVRHVASEIKVPVRDPKTPSTKNNPMAPSPYWGAEPIWDSQTSPHNPMFDERGRVWFTSRVRGPANPAFCGKGSEHPSAKIFPVERSNRQLSMYDPKTGKFTLIDTCFGTHHLYFAEDANNTLWASSGGAANEVLGWLNRKVFEETGDEQKAQGWTPFILDTNGNGKRDDYVGPNDPIDAKKDKRIVAGFYGLAPSPVDGSIWGSVLGYPGYIIRLNPGSNPPETALTEVFEPPFPGYSPRGMDIDRKGVVWAPLASGHFASFDRHKCKGPLNGPSATGK